MYKLRLDFTKFSADTYCQFRGSHLPFVSSFFLGHEIHATPVYLLVCVCVFIFIYILIDILLVYI